MRFREEHVELRMQLASAAEVRRLGLVARALNRDLGVVPAWQDGQEMRMLTEARLGARDVAEVFRMAAGHPVGGPGRLERRVTPGGAAVWELRGGSPWVATWLLNPVPWVESECGGEWYEPQVGLLVAVPERTVFLVHVLNNSDAVLEVVEALAEAARGGSLSAQVFWVKDRRVRVLADEAAAFRNEVLVPMGLA